jgi:hypothetical protein
MAATTAEEGVPPAPSRAQLEEMDDCQLIARARELGITPAQLGGVLMADSGLGLKEGREALIRLATAAKPAGPPADPQGSASASAAINGGSAAPVEATSVAPAPALAALATAWLNIRDGSLSKALSLALTTPKTADPCASALATAWLRVRDKPISKKSLFHVTISPQDDDIEAYERSLRAAKRLLLFGCFTVHNPNTKGVDRRARAPSDAAQEEIQAWQQGFQAWQQDFQQSLQRSNETHGFEWQLQPMEARDKRSMQEVEQMSRKMAAKAGKRGVPLIGTYEEAGDDDITNALEIALRQWESLQPVEAAQPSKGHEKKIDDVALRRLCNVERFSALNKLTTLHLYGTQIGGIADAAPHSMPLGATTWLATPLSKLEALTTLHLGGTHNSTLYIAESPSLDIADAMPLGSLGSVEMQRGKDDHQPVQRRNAAGDPILVQRRSAAGRPSLMGLTALSLHETPIHDVAPLAKLTSLSSLSLRCCERNGRPAPAHLN